MTSPNITDMMQAYAEDAVDFAQAQFGIQLDYSEASLAQVEHILDQSHKSIPQGFARKVLKRGPTPEMLSQAAKMFGGYIGEVMRRHLGGEWTLDSGIDAQPTISLALPDESRLFPPNKVYKRLVNGAEDDVRFYYQVIRKEVAGSKP